MQTDNKVLRAGTLLPAIEGELTGSETCRKPLPQPLPSEARLTLQRFGSREAFLTSFRFELLPKHTAPENVRRCFMGTAPSLANVDNAFGEGTACEWLVYQLTGISQLCGAMTKLDSFQYRTTAQLIRQYYFDLKVTELEVFFSRLAAGCYGKIAYGAVDPQAIMLALRQFRRERDAAVDFYEREEARRRREAALDSPTIMSREQYEEQCIRQPFLKLIEAQRTPPAPSYQINEDWSQLKGRQKPLLQLMVYDKKFVSLVKIIAENDKNEEKSNEK